MTDAPLNATPDRDPFRGAPSFPLRHRLFRLAWMLVWGLLASWTPPQMRRWRVALLRAFGADIHPTAQIYGSVRVWYPPNLKMQANASLGPGVICYSMAPIEIGAYTVVSQRAHLCAGTHDIHRPEFQIYAKPIKIAANVWICAEAFVGPGVTVGEGAVLAARAVTFRDLAPWSVYLGNPAECVKPRTQFERPPV